ncbi:MAG: hypothetical protein AAGI07_07170, partial [Bacteroidota bacterium]
GSLSFSFDQNKNEFSPDNVVDNELDTRTFSILPQIGRFVNDNVSIGGIIGFTRIKTEFISTNSFGINFETETSIDIFQMGPFARFHKSVSDAAYVFLQAELIFGFGSSESEIPDTKENLFTLQTGLRPGFIFFLTEKIGIEANIGFLGYNYSRNELDEDESDAKNTNSSFVLDLDLSSFNLGVQYYF